MGRVNYTDRDSKRSALLWNGMPEDIRYDANVGYWFCDDFIAVATFTAGAESNYYGPYVGFGDTGATITIADEVGGALTLASDGDNEGASISTFSKPFQISANLGELWFEARIKTSTIANTKHGFFLGFMDTESVSATVPIAADGTLYGTDATAANHVGFQRKEGDGDIVDFVYHADGVAQVDVVEDIHTLVADAYVRLGLHFDGKTTLTPYVNGVPNVTTYTVPDDTGTDFPADVRMGPIFAMLNATATTPGNSTLGYWEMAQMSVV